MSREENRARMPTVTAVVDEYRAVFGEGVRVTYASENGLTLGEPMPPIEGLRWFNSQTDKPAQKNVQVRKTKRR